MKRRLQIIILALFITTLFGDVAINNLNIIGYKYFANRFTIKKDSLANFDFDNSKMSLNNYKSPGRAMLLSGILPGSGQIYLKKWFRGLFFIALDGIAIGTWYQNNKLAEDKKIEYANYAYEHWDFSRWIHDYYKWHPENPPVEFSGGDPSIDFIGTQEDWDQIAWDNIREVFVNKSDSLSNCHEYPYCYTHIWEHSHSVEFTYNGQRMSSSSYEFIDVFEDLCGNTFNPSNPICSIELNNMNMNSPNGDTITINTSHHFYEGIQKYDMFFAGWDDNDSSWVIIKKNNDRNLTSSNQSKYRKMWGDYNKIKTLAMNGGKFMLINRVISMIDAIFLAKKWNEKNNLKVSLNTFPNLYNHSGLGRIQLSIYFK